ncbi:MAG: hypothetical protein CMJ20_00325 [Phycisphaeraceae bacterium]|nr:hypothetical protein [Phycisphaeraceae bacterium]|tara:strand:+ start:491 stop:1828 length:1338 start_codon:yes stop_codon:yes gene_type:complete
MASDLSEHIQQTVMVDSHEHLRMEDVWLQDGPGDVLSDLFFVPYDGGDLVTAGADDQDVNRLADHTAGDIESRFAPVADTWEAMQLTGFGEAVRLHAKLIYDMEQITVPAMAAAQPRLEQLRQPDQRLRLLRDEAKLDHVQVDNLCWACEPDESDPDFFLYDLNWRTFCNGGIEIETPYEAVGIWRGIETETGITVTDLKSLQEAMEAIFSLYGRRAIAVKSLHAYDRTLLWRERSDHDAERALGAVLAGPNKADETDRLCLGDWCLARGVELAIEYDLPFKIHTGYLARNLPMMVHHLQAGHLCELLIRYPQARFVLMHIAYPYNDELVAIAKHFPNVWVDLCWAWSCNPHVSAKFVRNFLHAVPSNKLFAFGGDTIWPTRSYVYSVQARKWLTKALEAEVCDGNLTEQQAMDVATRLMRRNQLDCFDVEGTRTAVRQAMRITM